MPKLRKETETDLSAMLADDVAIRKYRNQNIVSKIKRPKKSTSLKKKKTNDRFAKANKWATLILGDPAVKKLYIKGITSNLPNAQAVARTDYLEGPKIHYISLKQHTGAIGDKIRIKATDNFQVTAVEVKITDKSGKEIEKGPAERYKRKPQMWIYKLTVANLEPDGTIIKVTAMDRPKNKTMKESLVTQNVTTE